MTNVRARLFGFAACLLLTVPLLWTGCGQPPADGSPDVDVLTPADGSQPASDAAVVPPTDGGALKVDASATDAGIETSDADLTGADASTQPEDAAGALPDVGAAPDVGTAVVPDAAVAGPDAGPVCPRLPKAADRARKIVVAHPFKDDPANNYKAKSWDVLDLSATGVVTQPNPRVTLTMGRANWGEMVFTPDGEIGVAAQDDGSVAEVKFDEGGNVQVLQTGFTGPFYGEKVVMDPSGERFYVLDREVDTVGGGVYAVKIGCDGTLTNEGKVFGATMPGGLDFPSALAGKAFVAGKRVLASPGLTNSHLLAWAAGAKPTRVASVAAFPDDAAIVSDARVMPDGKWALVSDSAEGRVAVVELQASAVVATQVLSPFSDPQQIVVSPYGNAAAVLCSMSDSLWRLSFDSSKASPFAIGNKITTVQPGAAVRLAQGGLSDRVFIAELEGIRQVQFAADGTMTDLGLTKFLAGYEAISGAMGIQP
ncbi:MAG TPA: hypothetical protein VGK67_01950 [Myxococcales bacterium]|jgi:hypothetical protein